MNGDLSAMMEASPYALPKFSPPANPTLGQVHMASSTKRPRSGWPVLVYDGASWVCIGHGRETAMQAENRVWALEQLEMLSVGTFK